MKSYHIEGSVYFPRQINMAEAPEGFYPVAKESLSYFGSRCPNICRQCDWRAEHQKISIELLLSDSRYRCADYNRKDGVSVVFKRIKK